MTARLPAAERVPWTAEMIQRMGELVAERCTAEQIGRVLGISRNAVIGKMARVGIRSRNRAGPGGHPKTVVEPIEMIAPPPAPGPTVHILDLTLSTCRWPCWSHTEQPTMEFCGAQVNGGVYCERHARIAYQKVARP